jgi:8-oxo-dGTP diphosphatase
MITRPNINVRVGVQAVVYQDDKILLGQRQNMFQENSWGLPGGQVDLHLLPGETLLDMGVRKLFEETGLIATDAEVFCVTDPKPDSNYHMQIGILIKGYRGNLTIKEPDFCNELEFFPVDSLPHPIFTSSIDVISNYIDGIFYQGKYRSLIGEQIKT